MGIKINRPAPPKQVAQKDDETKDTPVAGDGEPLEVQQLGDAEPESALEQTEEAPEPEKVRPTPKTSPSPYLGMPVLFRTQDRDRKYNGSDLHPAIITRVWSKCVNLKVLPDCGAPYDATSQQRIAYSDVEAQGWFTIDEARSA